MSKNRIIYQSQAVFVGPSPAESGHFSLGNSGENLVKQLYRVQSLGHNFSINRQDVNQFGELGRIDSIVLQSPTVAANFSYLLSSFANEYSLGFTIDPNVSCISGILNRSEDEKNYFIEVVDEGMDALGQNPSTGNFNTIGIGNGFLNSYSCAAAVGSLPTVSIGLEALQVKFDVGTSGNYIPAIDPATGSPNETFIYGLPVVQSSPGTGNLAISVLRPGDITLSFKVAGTNTDFNEGGINIVDAKIQSYNLSFDLSRTPLQKLGSRFAFAREINFPVEVRLDVEAQVGDLTTGSLSSILCDDTAYDITVDLKKPVDCEPNAPIIAKYILRNAKLSSENFSSDIGRNKTVNVSFMTQIGGPSQTDVGLFLSGVYQ